MASMNEDFYRKVRNHRFEIENRGYQDPRDPFMPRQKTDDEIKISVLKEENEKLKNQYSDLIRKTTTLLEAYKKLEAENDTLKTKKAKRDSVMKTVSVSKNFFKKLLDDFINWLNT